MSKKTRYFLIGICFLFFIILAPIIVLYVRGLTFDFPLRKFVSTGILLVKTKPNDVQIFLDGQLVKKKSGNIKFLKPKEYKIILFHPKYWPWNKTLSVYPTQVTSVHTYLGKIFLLLQTPETRAQTNGVADFARLQRNLAIAYTNGTVQTVNPENFQVEKTIDLKNQITKIETAYKDDYIVISGYKPNQPLQNTWWFVNLQTGFFAELTYLLNEGRFFFSPQGDLYNLHEHSLYKINVQNFTKTLVLSNVIGASFLQDNFYALLEVNNLTQLSVSQNPETPGQIILEKIPKFSSGEIFVNQNKQLFLLLNNQLFIFDGGLKLLSVNVKLANLDHSQSLLTVLADGELGFYSEADENFNFITRSGSEIKNPIIVKNINYVFFKKNNQIRAVELDPRDIPNDYLVTQGDKINKFMLDAEGNFLWVLDGDTLKSHQIR